MIRAARDLFGGFLKCFYFHLNLGIYYRTERNKEGTVAFQRKGVKKSSCMKKQDVGEVSLTNSDSQVKSVFVRGAEQR